MSPARLQTTLSAAQAPLPAEACGDALAMSAVRIQSLKASARPQQLAKMSV